MSISTYVNFFSRTFGKGLAIFLPVLISAYVISWAVSDFDKLIRSSLQFFIPEAVRLPTGIGLFLFVLTTFLVGLLMYPWMTRRLLVRTDSIFRKVPLFKSVYSPVKDFFDMFGKDVSEQFGEVVIIKVPGTEMETLGFITKRDATGLPEGFLPENHVVVFVQWSSQIGGYTFIVPEDSVRVVDMTVEQGLRWALTAGLSNPLPSQTNVEDASTI